MQKGVAAVKISSAVPQESKLRITNNPASGCVPRRNESRRSNTDLHPHVHSSAAHDSQRGKHPKHPSATEWVSEVWSICTLEDHSVVERKGTLIPAATWANLEDIMLSEMSKTHKVCGGGEEVAAAPAHQQ